MASKIGSVNMKTSSIANPSGLDLAGDEGDSGLDLAGDDDGSDLDLTGEDDAAAALSTGSPQYASPEQLRRDELDARTDIYALGVLLYELATGRRPFPGDTPGVISSSILRDAPMPLTSARIDAPAARNRRRPSISTSIARCSRPTYPTIPHM